MPGNHDRYSGATGNVACRFGLGGCEDGLLEYGRYVRKGTDMAGAESLNTGNPYDFTFTHKGVRFIGLDSGGDFMGDYELGDADDNGPEGTGLTDEQMAALAALDPSLPRAVFMHHPVGVTEFDPCDDGACGPSLKDESIAFNYQPFMDLAVDQNIQLVLSGHTHFSRVSDYLSLGNLALPRETRPLFIQTPSATKEDGFGYRIIEAEDGALDPLDATATGAHLKIVGQLDADDRISLNIFDPNDPAEYVTLQDTSGLSVPFFIASSSRRVIIYNLGDNISKFEMAGRGWDGVERFDFNLRLEGEAMPVGTYPLETAFAVAGQDGAFVGASVVADMIKLYFENMPIVPVDVRRLLVDWRTLIDTRFLEGITLANERDGQTAVWTLAPLADSLTAQVSGAAEVAVIDQQGRVTGLAGAETLEEIPYVYYDGETKKIFIYFPNGYQGEQYTIRVTGLDDVYEEGHGDYDLRMVLRESGAEDRVVSGDDISTRGGAVQTYSPAWNLLDNDGGVAVKSDWDGNGGFELDFYAGRVISQSDFDSHSPAWRQARAVGLLQRARGANRRLDAELDRILPDLERTLADGFWLDGYHLSPAGEEIFKLDSRAVISLKQALNLDAAFDRARISEFLAGKFGLAPEKAADIAEAIDSLAAACALAAESAVNEAAGKRSVPKNTQAIAERKLLIGELLTRNPAAAIEHYRQAWLKISHSFE